MKINQISTLIDSLHKNGLNVQKCRLAFDYEESLVDFLRKEGYNFCIQDDAFGVQIIVSDADHCRSHKDEN